MGEEANVRLAIYEFVGQIVKTGFSVGWPNEKGEWRLQFAAAITREQISQIDYMVRGLSLQVDGARVHGQTMSVIWLIPFQREIHKSQPKPSRYGDEGASKFHPRHQQYVREQNQKQAEKKRQEEEEKKRKKK